MYRLADIEAPSLQKIISKNLVMVFDEVYGLGEEEAVKAFTIQAGSESLKEDRRTEQLYDFVRGIRNELLDEENEYTFSETGEYILYYTLKQYYESTMDKINADFLDDAWEIIPPRCESPLSVDEKEYVRQLAESMKKDLIMEMQGYPEMYDAEMEQSIISDYEKFVLRCEYPALLVMEIDEDCAPEFLFWDTDFMMIDEFGTNIFAKLLNSVEGREAGFSTPDSGEPVTGSEKFSLV